MAEFRRMGSIEYKVFKRSISCAKDQVFNRFAKGRLLIYRDEGKSIRIYCTAILTNYCREKIVADIRKIILPETDGKYQYLWIGLMEAFEDLFYDVCMALKELNGIDGFQSDIWRFDKMPTQGIIPCGLLIEVKNGAEKTVASDFGILSRENLKTNPGKLYFRPTFQDDEPYCVDSPVFDLSPNIPIHISGTMKGNVECEIVGWLNRLDYKEYERTIEAKVLGQKDLKQILVNVYLYLRSIVSDKPSNKHSVILAGPSGCGKTETYRALKEYFKKEIPSLVVSIIDMNQVTEEGFNGKNTNYIVRDLKSACSEGIGIVFLDEFDKRLIPEHTAHGDNINENIQSQLLMAIEGCTLDGVDTSKTMFIGMGSFDVVRRGRKTEKHIGFGEQRPDKATEHYSEITLEDMVNLGAIHELIGRFVTVINYGQLSYEAIDRIIDLRLSEICKSIGCEVSISDEMRRFLHVNANTAFGNRRIYSLIRESVNSAMIKILEDGISGSSIVVTGKGEYIIDQKEKRA